MPVYEYVCLGCEAPFEARREVDAPDPSCPSCGRDRVRRRFSLFAAPGTASAEARGVATGGCACGGACACGAH